MTSKVYKKRRRAVDRRKGKDRRKRMTAIAEERRAGERRVLLRRIEDILRER